MQRFALTENDSDYSAEKVRTLCASPKELRARWVDAGQRADRLKHQHVAFFKFFAPEAREILDDLLEKYASDGELHFTLSEALKVRPISDHGTVNEIIGKFGGEDQLRNALNQLQSLLYQA
jgi:type I restriction enzyme, R subunit